jgi:DNA-binding GntR family transcriptional regulator
MYNQIINNKDIGIIMAEQIRRTSVAAGKKPASILAQEKLLELFQNGVFKSEETLKESVLAAQFGVTRPAMREALNQAVGWGIVEYKPYCGYKIREFSVYDLLECYEMREAIEPIAAYRLAQVRPPEVLVMLEEYLGKLEKAILANEHEQIVLYDSKFHLSVIEHCGNKSFARMQNISNLAATFYINSPADKFIHTVQNGTSQFLGESFTDQEYKELNIKLTIDMHRKMLQNLQSGNAEEAEKLFRAHAHEQVKNLRNIIVFQGSAS